MNADLSEAELATYFALRRAARRLERSLAEHLKEYDLSEVQFAILTRLGDGLDGIGMTVLANDLVVTKGGLTYQARQLEARGLVARNSTEADERAVIMRLTARGAALLAEVQPRHREMVKELFIDYIAPADLPAMRTALERVADAE